jgi:hypothetical protein
MTKCMILQNNGVNFLSILSLMRNNIIDVVMCIVDAENIRINLCGDVEVTLFLTGVNFISTGFCRSLMYRRGM